MHRSLAALLGLAAACTDRPVGEDTDAGSTSTSTSTSTTPGEAPTTGTSDEPDTTTTDAEPCLELEYTGDHPPVWMLTCGLPELCPGDEPPLFSTTRVDARDPGDVEVDDLERARCMAAALRDRSLGQIAWSQLVGSEVIWNPLSLEITGDTALVRQVKGSYEPILESTDEAIYSLRPPEFFAACAAGDARAVWLCLVDAVEPMCLPGPLTCPK